MPKSTNRFDNPLIIKAPANAPTAVPTPPFILAPPTIAAAITSRDVESDASDREDDAILAVKTIAAIPDNTPEIKNT